MHFPNWLKMLVLWARYLLQIENLINKKERESLVKRKCKKDCAKENICKLDGKSRNAFKPSKKNSL